MKNLLANGNVVFFVDDGLVIGSLCPRTFGCFLGACRATMCMLSASNTPPR